MACMIYAHKLCKIVDEEAIQDLEDRIQSEERNATERTLVQAATFYWLQGGYANLEKAKDMCIKVLEIQPQYPQAQCLKGWIELALEDVDEDAAGGVDRAMAIFDEVLEQNPQQKELEALLGKAMCYERKDQLGQALELLNQVIVLYAWFLPALTEKARILLTMGDWEQALETAQRILSQDSTNIEALRLTVLFLLARESRYILAAKRISDLTDCIDRHEPKNARLYYDVSRVFARLSGRNPAILQATMGVAERARRLQPENCDYVVEFAYQQSLAGDYQGAIQTYRTATQLDELNMSSLYGTIHCQLLDNQLEDAAQQLEFLNEISVSIEKSTDLVFLSALLAWKKNHDSDGSVKLLDEALELHLASLEGKKLSYQYYVDLNCELLLEIARLYLQHGGSEPRQSTEPVSPNITKTVKVLELVGRNVPGMLEAHLMLARSRFLAADMEGSVRGVTQCLRLEPTFADAHILMAQIYLYQGNNRMAAQSLEQAMSHNFQVRESTTYNIVQAKVHLQNGDNDEALKVLETAMAVPGVKHPLKEAEIAQALKRKKHLPQIVLHERVSLFLLLAEVHAKLGHVPEATKVIQDALNEFAGTAEEVRVTIANCELALNRGDVEGALGMLRAIPRESPHYLRAKMAMADIYLKNRNDKAMYASCYLELVEKYPDVQTYCMLGEAFMQIQEPERAISAFESALAQTPKDSALASKIGKALVMTHDYQKAVDYYETAVRSDPTQVHMQHDLAELYYKLKHYEHAERVLNTSLDRKNDSDDIMSMMMDVKALLLLAQVRKGANDPTGFADTQMRARTQQTVLLSKIRADPELLRQQKVLAADICYTLAQEYDIHKNYERALAFYNEALRHNDTHTKSMLALAKLYLARGETDQCQQLCVTLLRADPDKEEASMMLAELMFRKEHYETAIYHFQQLLERKPSHYVALAQLVQLLRRAGRLSEVPRYLRMAEKASPRAAMDAGLHFCKGLYSRYSNNPHEALRQLNMGRKDGEWGARCIYNMVEIYLNPDNETVWDEALSDGRPMDNSEAVKAAEKLLKEIRLHPKPVKHHILECYALMATKQKNDIEGALNKLVELANTDRDSVPVLLAMATAFTMLKQTPKARNQLKRVAKMQYNAEEADDFEKSWLLLADIHIQGGKFDLAQEMCKKCLKYNKSCAKAWEGMGQIMEREQSYRDAADHYEMAWKFENEASPSVGYRLAFNYLKAKRFVEAIDVCHKVMAAFPNYPKIRKDIMEKARASIRP